MVEESIHERVLLEILLGHSLRNNNTGKLSTRLTPSRLQSFTSTLTRDWVPGSSVHETEVRSCRPTSVTGLDTPTVVSSD